MARSEPDGSDHGARRHRGVERARVGMIAIVMAVSLGVPARSLAAEKPKTKANPAAVSDATLYWYDGSVKRALGVSQSSIAEIDRTGQSQSAIAIRKSLGEVRLDRLKSNQSPVLFDKSAPGAAMRALPGGVIVTLETPATADAMDRLLAAFRTRTLRRIDGEGRRWLVESEPGLASLTLANRLHESGTFKSAAPNWWRERVRK
ncbi:MAG: hypothetical protein H6934_13380 [Burkholderiaceae bacterium]|nr:hypothetical protein [Burkholderiaceae bacterium]